MFCGAHAYLAAVNGVEQFVRPVLHIEAVEDPFDALSDSACDDFNASWFVREDLRELCAFLDGAELETGGVFDEFRVVVPLSGVGLDDARDFVPAELGDSREASPSGDEAVGVSQSGNGYGVQETIGCDGLGQVVDGLLVEFKASVGRVGDVDLGEAQRLVGPLGAAWVGRAR